MSLDAALERAKLGQAAAEEALDRELRIPSISLDPAYRPAMAEMRDLLVGTFRSLGFTVRLSDAAPEDEPVIEAEWLGAGDSAPLLTVYGHYDVQPPGDLSAWESDPFVPTRRGRLLYARGVADNKGNHLAAIKAAEYCIATGSPVNFRFLIEGQEEVWGTEFRRFVEQEAHRLRSDYTLLWDSSFAPEGSPLLVSAMRGIVTAQIDVTSAAKDLHSGTYGGVAPNAIYALAGIVAGLKKPDGSVDIPGFYDDVLRPEPEETTEWDRGAKPREALMKATGLSRLTLEPGVDPLDAIWSRPTLDVSGIVGGYIGAGAMGIIPGKASAKVGIRLVLNQDPEMIFEAFRARVIELAGPDVQVDVTRLGAAAPARLSYRGHAATALRDAFKESFGVAAVAQRIGGGMLPASVMVRHVGGEIISSGLNQPSPMAHAPNEHLDLDHFHKGTETLIRFIHALPHRNR